MDEFFELLRFTRVDERPRTSDELIDEAHTIVRASFNGVSDGRTIDYATGASNPIYTAVFELRVETPLKGPASNGRVYMEFLRGGLEVEAMRDRIPRDLSVIAFLREASGWDPPTYTIEGDGMGHPPGNTLLTYLGQEGIVIERNGELFYPLSDDPDVELFDESSIDGLGDLEVEVTEELGG